MSGIVTQNLNKQSGLIKAPEASGGGAWTFIKKLTASSSSTLSFVNGASDVVLDSTYKEYVFYFVNIHAQTDDYHLVFNASDDTSSHSYDITKTTSFFDAYQTQNATTGLGYRLAEDVAQGTGAQTLIRNLGDANDQSASGYLHLFDPSSTTFVKHFFAGGAVYGSSDESINNFSAGYFNTTAALTAFQFSMNSGNLDAGDIFLHGLSTS